MLRSRDREIMRENEKEKYPGDKKEDTQIDA